MATIANIISNGRGRTHGWRIERDDPMDPFRPQVTLVHYGTSLLRWNPRRPEDDHTILSTGWGSVSDQNGLNTAFKVLGLPYRMDRDQRGGGARITELVSNGDGHLVRSEA